jgi:hypothetical protein
MAAVDIAQASGYGQEGFSGQKRAVITASETNQLKTSPGRINRIYVWGAGRPGSWTCTTTPGANAHPVWQWLTARGNGEFAVEIPMSTGIRVVTSGTTAGSCTIVFS